MKLIGHMVTMHPDGLVEDCSISIATALKILQTFTKQSIYTLIIGLVTKCYIKAYMVASPDRK